MKNASSVPGYGMAVNNAIREMVDALKRMELVFAILQ